MLRNKQFLYFIFFSLTLFLGLYFKENASGGGKIDFNYLIPFIEQFSIDFNTGLNFYLNDTGSLIHSPVFYIITGKIYGLTNNILLIKITYVLISCYLPYVFYLILKEKYQTNFQFLFFFSLLIFLSPYFRSSAIWLLGDNLSLILFGLSIYFFQKRKNINEKFLNSALCFVFLILCSYIRYYYSLIAIYYLIIFFKELDLKKFFLLLLVCFLMSLPAIFYFNYILMNYNFSNRLLNYSSFNFLSNGLIILSILFFYLLPFIFIQKKKFIKYISENLSITLFIFLFFFLIFVIDFFSQKDLINFSPNGGGVFIKLSILLNINSVFLLSLISSFSILILDYFFKEKRIENYFLILILVFTFPIFTIYQKYFDPLFYLFIFGLMNSLVLKESFLKSKFDLKIISIYFLSFLIFSIIYNYNI